LLNQRKGVKRMKPCKIRFESKRDVVDYVTRGLLPPSKEDFDQFIAKVKHPDNITAVAARMEEGKEVVIPQNVVSIDDSIILEKVLTRVYENRVRNRNKIIVGLGVIGLLALAFIIRGDTKEEVQDEYDEFR
jgi:hypothetical protein